MYQSESHHISTFFKIIFRNFLMLLILTAMGGAAGFGLSYLFTPTWKATAQFDRPTLQDLGNYYSLYSTYAFLTDADSASYYVVKGKQGDLTLNPDVSGKAEDSALNGAYQEFVHNLTSPDTLLNYLEQTEEVKLKAQAENISPAIAAQETAKRFAFQAANKSTLFDQLSVVSGTPEEAHKLLTGFIAFTNQQTKTVLNRELGAKWKVLFQQIKTASEIKLGATRQGNQIMEQDWRGKLGVMRSVQALDDKLTAFRYAKEPRVPYETDSPNRLFWLTIGALSGLLFGMLFISALGVLKRKQRNG